MGACAAQVARETLAPVPQQFNIRTPTVLRRIIRDTIAIDESDIYLADSSYGCYEKQELQAFLDQDNTKDMQYRKQVFDCDDFATVLAGREKEWLSGIDIEAGTSFGIVHGDIRKKEDDTEPRYHAMNVFIDDKARVWLIEPQTGKISKPTSNSRFSLLKM